MANFWRRFRLHITLPILIYVATFFILKSFQFGDGQNTQAHRQQFSAEQVRIQQALVNEHKAELDTHNYLNKVDIEKIVKPSSTESVPVINANEGGSTFVKKRNTLVVITTCNHWEVTKLAIVSLLSGGECDILIVDDGSSDDTVTKAEKLNIKVIQTPVSFTESGLTASWNIGYQFFKDMNYDVFFIINNDVIVPKGAIREMTKNLIKNKELMVVSPLTTPHGIGTISTRLGQQKITTHFPEFDIPFIENSNNIQIVQDMLLNKTSHFKESEIAYRMKPHCLGFFLGFHRRIISKEYARDKLFDFHDRQIRQERSLYNRGFTCHVIRSSFVFHNKGTTLEVKKQIDGENREYYYCRDPSKYEYLNKNETESKPSFFTRLRNKLGGWI